MNVEPLTPTPRTANDTNTCKRADIVDQNAKQFRHSYGVIFFVLTLMLMQSFASCGHDSSSRDHFLWHKSPSDTSLLSIVFAQNTLLLRKQ